MSQIQLKKSCFIAHRANQQAMTCLKVVLTSSILENYTYITLKIFLFKSAHEVIFKREENMHLRARAFIVHF
jgi:hypothetical protein